MRAAAVSLVVLVSGLAAYAEPLSDGSVQARPGLWSWEQQTTILGLFDKHETNVECLIPEKASITLSRLARDLDKDCGVENVAAVGTGYNFTLVCRGKVKGRASATLASADGAMKIRAKGKARWGLVTAGLSMKADAAYVGDCSPEQIRREREKYLREQSR